jgi:hypothetical protein
MNGYFYSGNFVSVFTMCNLFFFICVLCWLFRVLCVLVFNFFTFPFKILCNYLSEIQEKKFFLEKS